MITNLLANVGSDPTGNAAFTICLMLGGALLIKEIMIKINLPTVLGEVLFGVLLGNLFLPEIKQDHSIEILAEIGVLVLMFEEGLGSSVGKMLKVGFRALIVALAGATASIMCGTMLTQFLFPNAHLYSCLFIGVTISATSVGISARVLKELNANSTPTGNLIVGGAVIDDIGGLIFLALITGLIAAASSNQTISIEAIGLIGFKAIGFLVMALTVGVKLSPRLFGWATKLQNKKILLTIGFSFCLFLSWLSTLAGLAAMIGAYAAGLIVEDVHYKDLADREDHTLEEVMKPLSEFFVPIFFVMVGAMVDIKVLMNFQTLQLAIFFTGAAIIGKMFCAVGTIGDKSVNKLAVIIGMIPRGEVVIIIAAKGKELQMNGLPIINEALYSAIIVVVIITTLITPPLLQAAFKRK